MTTAPNRGPPRTLPAPELIPSRARPGGPSGRLCVLGDVRAHLQNGKKTAARSLGPQPLTVPPGEARHEPLCVPKLELS